MKKQRYFWMDEKTYRKLKDKVELIGFKGKGALTRYIEKIANSQGIVFIESSEPIDLKIKSFG